MEIYIFISFIYKEKIYFYFYSFSLNIINEIDKLKTFYAKNIILTPYNYETQKKQIHCK